MISLLSMSCLILFISSIIMMLASLLSKKSFIDREKASPFECGFDPISSSRMPFSLRFFLIAVIFLIFDVEIALLFPLILIMNYSSIFMWFFTSLIFLIILLIGLYHEWNQGALNWAN
uniref:NADH-ubiquinone oxidoreductase chain 3 n=1 Tax=Neoneuromus tonkinensis TaxID=1569775 RepID=A0A0K0MDT7_9NEOP|nr:NADH dehydrogenase subunit 3 [Neoneuromus tonkinensis]AKA94238.1 NADH dehydrogenase subunit 3 [Neoneuromus tonkinensis]